MMFRAFSAIFLGALLVTLGQSRSQTSNNHAEGLRSARQANPSSPVSMDLESGIGNLFAALFGPLVNSLNQMKKTECDPDHQLFEDSCYFFSTGKADWVTAQDQCRGMGGNLVKISNDDEFHFIKDRLTGNRLIDNRWVGFSDQDSEGQFKWIADDSVFSPTSPWWHRGEPNDRSGNEDCGEFFYMQGAYKLNDNVCTGWELRYICEMELPYFAPE